MFLTAHPIKKICVSNCSIILQVYIIYLLLTVVSISFVVFMSGTSNVVMFEDSSISTITCKFLTIYNNNNNNTILSFQQLNMYNYKFIILYSLVRVASLLHFHKFPISCLIVVRK